MKFPIYMAIICASVLLVINPVVVSIFNTISIAQVLYLIFFDTAVSFILIFNIMYVKKRNNRYFFLSIISLVAFPLLMVFAEGALSFTRMLESTRWNDTVVQGVHRPDPVLGWALIPNTIGRHESPGNYDIMYYVDENGRRAIPQHEGVNRTLHFFGDSFTFGQGVSSQNTALSLLAKKIGKKANIINYGVMGYGIEQMFFSFRSNLNNIRAGDVVVFSPLSRTLNRNLYYSKLFYCTVQSREGYEVQKLPVLRDGQWVFLQLQDICTPLKTMLTYSYGLPLGTLYRLYEDAETHTTVADNADEILTRAAQLAQQRGAEILLVFLTTPDECRRRTFDVNLERLKTPYVSLMPYCPTKAGILKQLAFPTDPHWSTLGNAWAAGALEQLLGSELALF